MKKREALVGILALVILIVGCTESPGPSASPTSDPFVGGTKALEISFVTNAPPNEIYDKSSAGELSPFDVVVNIENVGEADITAANKLKLTLSGLYAGDFVGKGNAALVFNVLPITNDVSITALPGKEKGPNNEVIPGGRTQCCTVWEEIAYNKVLRGTLPDIPVEVEACYEYKTDVIGLYCLRKNPLDLRQSICKVDGEKTVYNSGAPVRITSFEEGAAGMSSILFTFTVKNFGGGDVSKVTTTTEATCSSRHTDKNKVYVKVDSGIAKAGAKALSCSGLMSGTAAAGSTFDDGYLTLDDETGEGLFSCRLSTSTVTGDAVKDLNIELVYDYADKVEVEDGITIKHLLS